MNITDIKIRKTFTTDPLKAIVSITIDDAIAIHDIKVIHANDHLFVVMPNKKTADGNYKDIVHPINSETRTLIERAVIEEYEEVLNSAPEVVTE